MDDFEEITPAATLARVRLVHSDGAVYVEFRNTLFATITGGEMPELTAGDLIFIRSDNNSIDLAPSDLWPEELWVGVIRLRRDDVTILADPNGRLRRLPTPKDMSLREGNTVEATDAKIIRVLADEPIKYLDLPVVDESTIKKFKTTVDSNLSFGDFGGLHDIVSRARELIEISLLRKDELAKIGARAVKGVLFTGAAGTGKTMLARIIASSTDAQFYEISGPEIFSKWYGQSEEVLRQLFDDAAKQERAIIFFDEIDSVAGQRDDESHEASRRVVAQLLTLMDGFTPNDNVIVIAATNRPQDIDIALRRPGRFDWEIHFPSPDQFDREDILRKTSRNKAIYEPLPYAFIAHSTEGWSAAELAAIWSEAALLAVKDGRAVIVSEDCIGGFERVSAQRQRTGLVIGGGAF